MRGSMLTDRNSKGRTAGRAATLRGVLVAVGFALGASAMAALAAEPTAPQATPAATATEGDTPNPHTDPNNKWGFFEHYCEKCHNSTDWAGGVAFDTMSQESIPDDAKELEEAVRKLQGRLMPPPGKPQPDQQTIDNMVGWLTTRLDEAGAAHPNPG